MKPDTDYNIINELDNYITQKHYRLVNSVLIYKNEEILVERYYNKFNKESRNNLKSVWKSIIAICAGICLDKGYIKSLNDPVSDYIPIFDGSCHPYHKMLKITQHHCWLDSPAWPCSDRMEVPCSYMFHVVPAMEHSHKS